MKMSSRSVLKATLGSFMFALLFWAGGASVFAQDNSTQNVAELQLVIEQLIEQRNNIASVSEAAEMDLGKTTAEIQLALLDEIRDIFHDARLMANRTNQNFFHNIPIMTSWSGPQFEGHDRFSVGLSDERYLPLISTILEFTGIDESKMDVRIVGVAMPSSVSRLTFTIEELYLFDELYRNYHGQEVYQFGGYVPRILPHSITPEELEELLRSCYDTNSQGIYQFEGQITNILPSSGRVLNMGTSIMIIRHMGDGWHEVVHPAATLGHPRNASGTTAFTTHHNAVRVGDVVAVRSTGERIGVISAVHWHPARGLDLSYIRLDPGMTVSSALPNGTGNIASYFSPPPSNYQSVRMFGAPPPISGSGIQSGIMWRPSVRVDFIGLGTFHNVMEVNIFATFGDSGAALTHTNTRNVIGTLIGSSNTERFAWFSPAIEYQFR